MRYTVYQTTNSVNQKIYIGVHKTADPDDRYLGSGKVLKEAVKKYGRSAFVKIILAAYDTLEEAYAKEAELVNSEFVLRSDTYNQVCGGVTTVDWTDERKAHYSQRLRGENHPQWGKPLSPETKAKQSASLTGRKRNPEAVEKTAAAKRGKPSPLRGIPQSSESNEKRSLAHKNLEKVVCSQCNKEISPQNAKRWHFENCKPRKPRLSKDRAAVGWAQPAEKPNGALSSGHGPCGQTSPDDDETLHT